LTERKPFTKPLNGLKTTFPKWPERNPYYPLANNKRQTMSIIIRVAVIAACAYAGSIVAGIQFPDLADPYQIAQK
jgi:hypothetical protein